MTADLTDEEYERILALSHLKRMAYVMKSIAQRRELWTLARDGELLLLGERGAADAVPVWPDERFARTFAEKLAPDAAPLNVSLDDLLETWIPQIRAERRRLALFPLVDGEGGDLDAWQFEEDIRAELAGPLPLP